MTIDIHPNTGRCIYCGDYKKFTEEHVWPDWIRAHLRFDSPGFGKASVDMFADKEIVASLEHRQGDPRNLAVKKVCAACNNEWMSELQVRAKPILLPMIKGDDIVLGEDDQRIVAAWVTMAVMTGEHYFLSDSVAIPPVERMSLRHTSSPLQNWKISAGIYQRETWQGYFAHSARGLVFDATGKPLRHTDAGNNTQTTTLFVGKAFFHAFSCPSPQYTDVFSVYSDAGSISQIWPYVSEVHWPTPPIDDLTAKAISTRIFDMMDGRDRRSRTVSDFNFR